MLDKKNSRGFNHSFSVQDAQDYGIEGAILIHHFQYWIRQNATVGRNFHDGHTWMYQSQKEIAALFPYWSEDQIYRVIKKLIDSEVLVKGNYNKSPYDRTQWYAFSNEEMFSIPRNRGMNSEVPKNGNHQSAEPIPNVLTDAKTDIVCSGEPDKENSLCLTGAAFCEIRLASGEIYKLRADEIFTHAVQHKKDWDTNEITQAWEIIAKCKDVITCWKSYVHGIIERFRTKEKSEQIAKYKEAKKCENQKTKSKKKPESSEINSLEPGIVLRPFLDYLSPNDPLQRYRTS